MGQSESANTSLLHRLASFFGVHNITELSVILTLPAAVLAALAAWLAIPTTQSSYVAPPDPMVAAFHASEGDFQIQLVKLQDPDISAQAFRVSKTAAIEDIVHCTEDVRKLREKYRAQEARWKEFDAKIAEDERSLGSVPNRHPESPDRLSAAYGDAQKNFQSDLDKGEELLESVNEGGGVARYQAIDQCFAAAERDLVNQQIALGRLERSEPSQSDAWNTDKRVIETEVKQLNDDWNLVEAHNSGEATASYQN